MNPQEIAELLASDNPLTIDQCLKLRECAWNILNTAAQSGNKNLYKQSFETITCIDSKLHKLGYAFENT